ncbi:hypothetical protein HanIR_Chr10g0487491 [Helianthus annuus]|nr:hypothetical protein HanIR_Chr10g0487491 [Helianthus annuus]
MSEKNNLPVGESMSTAGEERFAGRRIAGRSKERRCRRRDDRRRRYDRRRRHSRQQLPDLNTPAIVSLVRALKKKAPARPLLTDRRSNHRFPAGPPA